MFKVGDVLVSTWGCGMTIVDFYKVIKATDKSVSIQHLKSKIVSADEWGQSGYVVPDDSNENDSQSKLLRRKIRTTSFGDCILISNYQSAILWDGKPKNFNTYD